MYIIKNHNKIHWNLKEEFYGGGGVSWLAEKDHLALVTCLLPTSDGCKKITKRYN